MADELEALISDNRWYGEECQYYSNDNGIFKIIRTSELYGKKKGTNLMKERGRDRVVGNNDSQPTCLDAYVDGNYIY